MSNYIWDILEERDIGQLQIVVDKTWDDTHPSHCFDTSIDPDTGKPYFDIEDICTKIDNDQLEWFVLRARVFYEGIELGRSIVGGFLYEDSREVLTDGTAEDLMWEAVQEAKKKAVDLKTKFMELDLEEIE